MVVVPEIETSIAAYGRPDANLTTESCITAINHADCPMKKPAHDQIMPATAVANPKAIANGTSGSTNTFTGSVYTARIPNTYNSNGRTSICADSVVETIVARVLNCNIRSIDDSISGCTYTMPANARNESWNPTSHRSTSGLYQHISTAVAAIAIPASESRPIRVAVMASIPIIDARTTEAVAPTITVKRIIATTDIQYERRVPSGANSDIRTVAMMVMLYPDKATI